LVQANGLTPNQFRRRLRDPYDADLAVLWKELGVPARQEVSNCKQCLEQNFDVDAGAGLNRVLERVRLVNGDDWRG
jgi:hypothetical protein